MLIGPVNKLSMSSSALLLAEVQALLWLVQSFLSASVLTVYIPFAGTPWLFILA